MLQSKTIFCVGVHAWYLFCSDPVDLLHPSDLLPLLSGAGRDCLPYWMELVHLLAWKCSQRQLIIHSQGVFLTAGLCSSFIKYISILF